MDAQQALRLELASGPQTARVLSQRLGVSQPTVSRLLARQGAQVVRLGGGRNTRYLLARELTGVGAEVPIYQVDELGSTQRLGALRPVLRRGFLLETSGPAALAGDEQLFEHGLPFFLSDLRPQGFLGRAFVRANAALGLPDELSRWTDDDVLRALVHRGEDLPGNFLLGDAFDRWAQLQPAIVSPTARARSWPTLAQRALEGGATGSSAGGEQPKFSALVGDRRAAHWKLVKFSPPLGSAAGRRWGDLLALEHLALALMREAGQRVAQAELIEAGGRRFLELQRFDRVGARGRRGQVSLEVVEAEWFGVHDDWLQAAGGLERAGRLSPADANALRWQWLFGKLIGNTDMHFGNVSFTWDGSDPVLRLAPAYDMLPMRWAPVREELTVATLAPFTPRPEYAALWATAREAARAYWSRAAQLKLLHPSTRSIARQNLAVVTG